MSARYAEVRLRVPDNTAFTACVALRRVGVDAAHVVRAQLISISEGCADDRAIAGLRDDESVFNPNLHEIAAIHVDGPRPGEIWIAESGRSAITSWRLYDADHEPLSRIALVAAAERLLCNPAVETAEVAE